MTGIRQNAPVLQLLSQIGMQPCDTVAKRPLPCTSYGSFKMFKISASEFRTVGMCRRMRACRDEFLAMVTEGVVHGVYKGCDSVIFRCNTVTLGQWR